MIFFLDAVRIFPRARFPLLLVPPHTGIVGHTTTEAARERQNIHAEITIH